MTLRLTRELIRDGHTTRSLRRLAANGEIVRIRHGAYADPDEVPDDASLRHLQLLEATAPRLGDGTVLSHATAAVLHGLVVPPSVLDRVTATTARVKGGGSTSAHLRTWATPLLDDDIVDVDGYRVTSRTRTLLDMARLLDWEAAVTMLDAALHLSDRPGHEDESLRQRLVEGLAVHPGRTGKAHARLALQFADGRAESPLESRSRIFLADAGLPQPVLQYELLDDAGHVLARFDFAWPQQKVYGECDGKVKYGALLAPDETAADVVMREKRREELARGRGWFGVRWDAAALASPRTLALRVRHALEREHLAS